MFNRYLTKNEFLESEECYAFSAMKNEHHLKKEDFWMKSSAVIRMIDTVLDNHSTLLDVGCGASHLAAYLRQRDDRFKHVVALDTVDIFPYNYKYDIDSIMGDFQALDLDSHFDVILDVCSIHLFDIDYDSDCPNAGVTISLKKIYDLLNPGGWFLMCTDASSNERDKGQFIGPMDYMDIASDLGFKFSEFQPIDNPDQREHPFDPGMGPLGGGPIQIYMLALQKV